MPTIDEIRRDRDAAIKVIDRLLIAGHGQLSAVQMQDLRDARNQIEDAALQDILASEELATSLNALAQVALHLGNVASNEQIAARVVGDFAGVLGKANTVINTARNVLGAVQ